MTKPVIEGELLWQPSFAQQSGSRMADYVRFLTRTRGLAFSEYAELYAWSIRELGEFWVSIAEYFQVKFRHRCGAGADRGAALRALVRRCDAQLRRARAPRAR